jgi:hypothetical protein
MLCAQKCVPATFTNGLRSRTDSGLHRCGILHHISSVKPVFIPSVPKAERAIWRFTSAPPSQGDSLGQPFSARAFISEYAVSMSLLRAAAFVAVAGLSFTWRMNFPVPCSKRAGSGNAAP